MVRRFGIVKSLNGRLSRECSTMALDHEELEDTGGGSNEVSAQRLYDLTEQLVDCRSCLFKTQRELESLRVKKEKQLSALCHQLLVFEAGLRRKQRELSLAISQRDRVIREQGHVIRFLSSKTGGEKIREIQDLRKEALSKIPQLQEEEQEEEEEGHNKTPKKLPVLSSIIETGSEHDSDSAIILDDNTSSSSSSSSSKSVQRISRSISDVVNDAKDDDIKTNNYFETGDYPGFLLHFESADKDREVPATTDSNECLDSIVHAKQLASAPRKVTKPRDVKNRHKKTNETSSKTTNITTDNETGSVICSIFDNDSSSSFA